ncbi:hypothetical protein FPQ18DRAFT_300618 [Pyronema domesticum]|nr:hypothetical protein FPQ18DRAFT_300618 [Pyronema domesticum]
MVMMTRQATLLPVVQAPVRYGPLGVEGYESLPMKGLRDSWRRAAHYFPTNATLQIIPPGNFKLLSLSPQLPSSSGTKRDCGLINVYFDYACCHSSRPHRCTEPAYSVTVNVPVAVPSGSTKHLHQPRQRVTSVRLYRPTPAVADPPAPAPLPVPEIVFQDPAQIATDVVERPAAAAKPRGNRVQQALTAGTNRSGRVQKHINYNETVLSDQALKVAKKVQLANLLTQVPAPQPEPAPTPEPEPKPAPVKPAAKGKGAKAQPVPKKKPAPKKTPVLAGHAADESWEVHEMKKEAERQKEDEREKYAIDIETQYKRVVNTMFNLLPNDNPGFNLTISNMTYQLNVLQNTKRASISFTSTHFFINTTTSN